MYSNYRDLFAKREKAYCSAPIRDAYYAWRSAIEGLALQPGAKILDFCCGQGHHSITLQKLQPKAMVHGFDIDEQSIAIANEMASQFYPGKSPKMKVMDAHRLEYPDSYFSCTSDFGSLAGLHFDRALSEVRRVLKSGGYFVGVERLGHNPVANLVHVASSWIRSHGHGASENAITEDHISKIRQVFREADFRFFGLSTLVTAAFPIQSEWLRATLETLDQSLFSAVEKSRRFAFYVVFKCLK